MKIQKMKWYEKKEITKIAKYVTNKYGIKITTKNLCDTGTNGLICEGGYGCNILDKIKSYICL